MKKLDWPGLLRCALRELRLTPKEFWALTPVELAVMLGRDGSTPALTRAVLTDLAARFPDVVKEKQDDPG